MVAIEYSGFFFYILIFGEFSKKKEVCQLNPNWSSVLKHDENQSNDKQRQRKT